MSKTIVHGPSHDGGKLCSSRVGRTVYLCWTEHERGVTTIVSRPRSFSRRSHLESYITRSLKG